MRRLVREIEMRYYESKTKREKRILVKKLMRSSRR